jgi:hypothetical protein
MEAQQIQEIQRVLNAPVVALAPDKFTHALQNAVNQLQQAIKTEPYNESLEDGKDVFMILSLVRDVFDILQDEILKVRNLTPEESRLLAELDKAIGKAAFRASQIVRGLKQFEAMSQGVLQ